ncbi:MAG: hypothetical protein JXA37_13960 [Chloroflexia bacterium]|nr:hypothetical protein [Chloroflexia bacterium]
MNTRKWIITSGTILLALLSLLVLSLGSTQAQGPGPEGAVSPQVDAGTDATVYPRIPVQGRITDKEGNPLTGPQYITMSLYSSYSGGEPLCQEADFPVTLDDGLFSGWIGTCSPSDINGQQLYFAIQVGKDEEMSPRHVINPVPYAWSLRPGAIISDTRDVVMTLRATGTGDQDALVVYAGDEGEAITANSPNGAAIFAWSDTYVGIQGYSNETADHPGVFGCSAADNPTCDAYRDVRAAGVVGYSPDDIGVAGYGESGVMGVASEVYGVGVWAIHQDNGIALLANSNSSDPTSHSNPTLYLIQQDGEGDFVVGANQLWTTRYWRVDRTGKGFFNGGVQSSGADFAEQIAVEGQEADYEPGDVLVISARTDRAVELAGTAFDPAVIGVYSTEPGVLAGAPDTDDLLGGIPVAITGIVPCKVSAENGAVQRGDLLVTAATPGYAMRAGDAPPQGTVLGKALGELDEGLGLILVLVTLQ